MYNRLLILLSSLTLVLTQNFKLTPNSCDYPTLPRRSIYDIGDSEWRRYVSAIQELNSGPRPTKWDRIAQLHGQIYEQIHSSATFLGWHRAYLHYVEMELRKVDSSITIPYWDWSYYSQSPESDPALSDSRFGYDGNPNQGECLRGGTFEKFRVLYDGNNNPNLHCIRRNVRQRDGKATSLISYEVLNRSTLNSNSFEKFWQNLEFGAHAIIHNFLSSDFASHTSPNDPLFFSHHAFVDKLWFDWQQRNSHLADTYTFDHNIKSMEDTFKPFDIKVKDVLQPDRNLCYTYRQSHFSWDSENSFEDRNDRTNTRHNSRDDDRDDKRERKNDTKRDDDKDDKRDRKNDVKRDGDRNDKKDRKNDTKRADDDDDDDQDSESSKPASRKSTKPKSKPAADTKSTTKKDRRSYQPAATITTVNYQFNLTTTPINQYYEVECDSTDDHLDYDYNYVMENVMAPDTYDRSNLYQLRVPLPLPIEFCEHMNYNITKVRQMEREHAILIDYLNRNNYKAKDALWNANEFPKLNREC